MALDFSSYNPKQFQSDFSEFGYKSAPSASQLSKVADIQAKIDAGQKVGSASQAFYDKFLPAYNMVSSALNPVTTGTTTGTTTTTGGISNLGTTGTTTGTVTGGSTGTTADTGIATLDTSGTTGGTSTATGILSGYDPAAFASQLSSAGYKTSPTLANLQKVADLQARVAAGETLGSASQKFLDKFLPAYNLVTKTDTTDQATTGGGQTTDTTQQVVDTGSTGSAVTIDNLDPENKLTKKLEGLLTQALSDWASTGELSQSAEATLMKIGKIAGQDYLNAFSSYEQPTTPITLSDYLSPTTYEQDLNQILGLSFGQERTLDELVSKARSGQTLTAKEQSRLNDLLAAGKLGTYEDYISQTFAPTSTDLFANLNYKQEQQLANLAESYASGDTLNKKQLSNLSNLLSAAGLGNIESYFAPATYTNPTGYESFFGAGEITADSNIGDIITSFDAFAKQNDPVAAAQYAKSLGLDESEIVALLEGYGTQKTYGRAAYTQSQLEDIFKRGETGLQDRINTIFTATLGNDEQIEDLTDYFNTNYDLDLTVQDVKDMYSADTLKEKSVAEIENFLQTSAFNKLQEAGRLGGVLSNVFGYGSDDIKEVLTDVMSTAESVYDPEIRNIYNELIKTDTISDDLQTKILQTAARVTPDSKFWTKQYDDAGNLVHDGELLYMAYSNPITKTIYADANQYGTYNGAPVLHGKSIRNSFKDKDSGSLRFNEVDLRGMGWNLESSQGYPGAGVKKGLDAIGINSDNLTLDAIRRYDDIMSRAKDQGMQGYVNEGEFNNYFYGAPTSTGEYTYYKTGVDVGGDGETVKYENPYIQSPIGEGEGGKNIYSDVKTLQDWADQLGIKSYTSLEDLYNKVQDASKDLYLVVGETTNDRLDAPKGKNHAAVLYRDLGDKLVAINDPTYFRYDRPEKSWFSKTFGSDIGGIFDDLLTIAPAEILLLTPAAGYYPLAKAAQVGAQPGSDIGDVLKAGGLAFLQTQFIPEVVAPKIAGGIANLPGIKDLSTGMQSFIASTGTNALLSAGIAGLTNKDIGEALASSLSVSALKGLGNVTLNALENSDLGTAFTDVKDEFINAVEKLVETDGGEQFSFKNIDPRFKDLVTNIFVDTMFGKDLDDAVQSGIIRMAMSEAKSAAKTKRAIDATKTKYEV